MVNLLEPLADQLIGMLTWWLAAVADIEDLARRDPGRARIPDEDHLIERAWRRVAVAEGRSIWLQEEAIVLVEAQNLRRTARTAGELADQHRAAFLRLSTFQRTGTPTVLTTPIVGEPPLG